MSFVLKMIRFQFTLSADGFICSKECSYASRSRRDLSALCRLRAVPDRAAQKKYRRCVLCPRYLWAFARSDERFYLPIKPAFQSGNVGLSCSDFLGKLLLYHFLFSPHLYNPAYQLIFKCKSAVYVSGNYYPACLRYPRHQPHRHIACHRYPLFQDDALYANRLRLKLRQSARCEEAPRGSNPA